MSWFNRWIWAVVLTQGVASSACRPRATGAGVLAAGDATPFANIPLGAAFDAASGVYKDPCVQGSVQLAGGGTQSLSSTYGFNQTDGISAWSGSYSVGADLGIIGAKSQAEGLHRVSKTAQTLSLTRVFSTDLGSLTLEQRSYSDRGQAAMVHNSASADCGQAFAYRKRLGSRLYLTAKIQFDAVTTLNQFVLKYSVSAFFGLFKKTITLPPAQWQDFKGKGYLVVSGTQTGGDEQAFKALLAATNGQPCPLGQLSDCLSSLQALMAYATGNGGYLDQFKSFKAGTWSPDSGQPGPAVVAIEAREYAESGHVEIASKPQPPTDPAVFLVVNDLTAALTEAWSIRERIDFLLSITDVAADKKMQLSSQAGPGTDKTIQNLQDALTTCQTPDRRGDCVQRGRAVLAALVMPTAELLNF